jgi:hypothetical protein
MVMAVKIATIQTGLSPRPRSVARVRLEFGVQRHRIAIYLREGRHGAQGAPVARVAQLAGEGARIGAGVILRVAAAVRELQRQPSISEPRN